MRLLVPGGTHFPRRHAATGAPPPGHPGAPPRHAAAVLGGVRRYAFVSSLNAYASWPPGPIGPEDDQPTWQTDDDEYGPVKAFAEREIGAAVAGRRGGGGAGPGGRPASGGGGARGAPAAVAAGRDGPHRLGGRHHQGA